MLTPRSVKRIARVLPATLDYANWSSRDRTRGARYYEVIDLRTNEPFPKGSAIVWADTAKGEYCHILKDESGHYRRSGRGFATEVVSGVPLAIRLREVATC